MQISRRLSMAKLNVDDENFNFELEFEFAIRELVVLDMNIPAA